jgi:hypothetical protein
VASAKRAIPVVVVQHEARRHEAAGGSARHGCGRIIAGQRIAIGAEPSLDCVGELWLLGGDAYRT